MSIEAIRFATPSLKQTSHDIAQQTGASEEFIREKIGLKERYLLSGSETGVGLSVQACKKLIKDTALELDEIDLIVCITQNPDRKIPHNSPQVCHNLNLSAHVASFDLSLGCSGWVYGVNVTEGFLQAANLTNAILITCDPYSRIIAPEDKGTNCVFGDMATATWIKAGQGRSEVLGSVFGTDGNASDAIEVVAGGVSNPFVLPEVGDSVQYDRDELRLNMKGRAVFNFVMKNIPSSIAKCLRQADLKSEDIDYYALHQGSTYMLDAMAKQVPVPVDKLLKNMASYGNTVSSTIPSLLAELDEKGRLSDSTILVSGFGVGLSWATLIIKFN